MAGKKKFRAQTSQDFTIIDDDGIVCRLRVKAAGIAVKGRNEQKYHQVYIEDFMEFAKENGFEVTR